MPEGSGHSDPVLVDGIPEPSVSVAALTIARSAEDRRIGMTTTESTPVQAETDEVVTRRVYSALTGLTGVAVLLQGVWAGLFLEDHAAGMWIEVHARGGEVAIVLAVLAALWALFRLRSHRDLVIGAIVLAVLLVVEAYIGGLIHDDGVDALTPVHLPLALLLMGLTVWLPLRASGGTRRSVRTGPAHHVDR
jgi:hypothetical protein